MNILLAEETIKNGKQAGSKARKDVQDILVNRGYKYIRLYKSETHKIIEIATALMALLRTFCLIKKNDFLIVEHPYIPMAFSECLAIYSKILYKSKKIHSVIIIHDINCIRFGVESVCKEISVFNRYEYVICHNAKMHEWLINNNCNSNIIELGVFDYVCDFKEIGKRNHADFSAIIIAGNLSKDKSGYIYSLPLSTGIMFNLYGVGVDTKKLRANCYYKGTFLPEELPKVMEGKFGLVWDGESCETCKGLCGEYLRINNPHKLSLFLVAGIPVIVWKESAVAEMVMKNGLGICVDTLNELEEVLNNISDEEYNCMIKNVSKIKDNIRNGRNLILAMNSVEMYERKI